MSTNGVHTARGRVETTPEGLASLNANIERLKQEISKLDAHREKLIKARPAGSRRSTQEMEAMLREMAHAMERESLTMKEEKAALEKMKKMKDHNKKSIEWDTELDDNRNRRAQLAESLRQLYEELDRHRDAVLFDEVSEKLGVAKEELRDLKLQVTPEMAEMLATSAWKKRLQSEQHVIVRASGGKGPRLIGTAEAVESAAALIHGFGPAAVRRVQVDEMQQGLLIGRKGATIAQLQESTGCALELKKSANQLIIAGTPPMVLHAENLILEMLESQRRVELVVKFDPEQKHKLLGKGGATIKRIQQESGGAMIDLDKGSEGTVTLSGPNACVLKARKAVVELLRLDAESVRAVEVPSDIVDAVIGKGGENLSRLEEEHGVSIGSNHRLVAANASADGSGGVVQCRMQVRGSVEGVKRAVEALGKLIDIERRVEEQLDVESQHVGMLLGKGGITIKAIQRETGVSLEIEKRPDEAGGTQRVTIKGNTLQVRKASAALEAVLQYKAEAREEISVDPRMMPQLIGKGGEEINRIRAKTGAAIDVEPESKLKIRGSLRAVAEAKQEILDAIAANKPCVESVVLPWHAVDVLLGSNAANLVALEADFHVQVELPGQSLASEIVGSGSFLGISSSMSLRGRKKFVDAAAAEVRRIEREHATETLELTDEDAELLSWLCLEADGATPLESLQQQKAVRVTFSPTSGVVVFRGEDTIEARVELQELLAAERFSHSSVPCGETQAALLLSSPAALADLQSACEPLRVAMQHDPAAVIVSGATRALPAAAAAAAAWLSAHRAAEARVPFPPEVAPLLKPQLRTLVPPQPGLLVRQAEGEVVLSGPAAAVDAAAAVVGGFVRRHARVEETLQLAEEAYALACVLRTRNIFDGVEAAPRGGGVLLLKGTDEAVSKAKTRLQAVLAEAERCALVLPLNGAQADKLLRTSGREREPLLRKLQETHECALLADKAAMQLRLHGRAEAVVRMQAALEVELDIDEHVRDVSGQMIPVIIGKAGATIKRLQQTSGATFDLDRDRGRLRVFGRKLCVRKALLLLDELSDEFGAMREMDVAQRQISQIIGRGGATIKSLQAESGATIEIRKDECTVRIKGSQAAVDEAVRRIELLLATPSTRAEAAAPHANGAPPGLRGQRPANGPPPGLGAAN